MEEVAGEDGGRLGGKERSLGGVVAALLLAASAVRSAFAQAEVDLQLVLAVDASPLVRGFGPAPFRSVRAAKARRP